MIHALGAAYGRAALWRRRWYARDQARVRSLARPVVSVGNLRVGGTGKTPIAAYLAALLRDAGERPAILTRGYHREHDSPGVTVVSDGRSLLAPLERTGDEPLLLARILPNVPVLVARDRYLAGRMAETQFGATVHILDDGFQHFELRRRVDLLLASEDDLTQAVVPAGELREPLRAAAVADALLATTDTSNAADRLARDLGIATAFRVTRMLDGPHDILTGERVRGPASEPIFVAAAIARPERFVADVISNGWQVGGTMTFRDHHPFSAADVAQIESAARRVGATLVLTTEKDAVRLERRRFELRFAAVPLRARVEPESAFRDWLLGRLRR